VSKSRKGGKVFVVERVAWKVWTFNAHPIYEPCRRDGGSFVPVRAFTNRKAAEAYRQTLEAEARATFSPAHLEHDLTREDFRARLQALGLKPLNPRSKEWDSLKTFRDWWVEHAAELSPEQRAAVWKVFDEVTFYRVTEAPLTD
jgi:hypothetical protein